MKFHSNYILYLSCLTTLFIMLLSGYMKRKSQVPLEVIAKWTGSSLMISSLIFLSTAVYQYFDIKQQAKELKALYESKVKPK